MRIRHRDAGELQPLRLVDRHQIDPLFGEPARIREHVIALAAVFSQLFLGHDDRLQPLFVAEKGGDAARRDFSHGRPVEPHGLHGDAQPFRNELQYMIKELMFEGSNRHFDQALCAGLTITDEDVETLCKAMKEQAVKNAHNEDQKASIKDVGRQQLRSWGILIERDGKDYPIRRMLMPF